MTTMTSITKAVCIDQLTSEVHTTYFAATPGPDELIALAASYCKPGTDLSAHYRLNGERLDIFAPGKHCPDIVAMVWGLGFEHGPYCDQYINHHYNPDTVAAPEM